MAHAASQLKKKADLDLTALEEEKEKKKKSRKRIREPKKKDMLIYRANMCLTKKVHTENAEYTLGHAHSSF
ncbi:unnamed protein product [Leuciscus chuanchicus]